MKKIAIITGLTALVAAGPALTDEFTDRAMKEQQFRENYLSFYHQ